MSSNQTEPVHGIWGWVRRDGLVLLSYLLLTLVMTFPLILHMATQDLPYSPDLGMKLWDLFWFDKVVMHGKPLFFSSYLFYPRGLDLSYHPMSWTTTALMWPLSKIIGVAPTFKVQYLFAILLPAYGGYLLVRYLTSNRLAGWFGGLVYGFASSHMYHVWTHPDLSQVAALPLAVLLLFEGVRQPNRLRRWLYLAGAGLMVALLAWTSLYLFGFTVMTLGPVVLYLLLENNRWRARETWWGIGVFVLVAGALSAPRLYPIFSTPDKLTHVIEEKYDEGRPYRNMLTLLTLVIPFNNPMFEQILPDNLQRLRPKLPVYLGIITLALAGLGLAVARPRNRMRLWALLALLFFLMCLGPESCGYGQALECPPAS